MRELEENGPNDASDKDGEGDFKDALIKAQDDFDGGANAVIGAARKLPAEDPMSCVIAMNFANTIGELEGMAILAGLAPRDSAELLICSQLATTQYHIRRVSGGFADADTLERMEAYERMHSRLCRTFAKQMEALRRHRIGGTQTVKHVHVNEGGQAVVADVVNSGGGA